MHRRFCPRVEFARPIQHGLEGVLGLPWLLAFVGALAPAGALVVGPAVVLDGGDLPGTLAGIRLVNLALPLIRLGSSGYRVAAGLAMAGLSAASKSMGSFIEDLATAY